MCYHLMNTGAPGRAKDGWGKSRMVQRGWVKPLKLKKLKHYTMLNWPQNTGNPISKDLTFENFLGKDAVHPLKRTAHISNPLP